MGTNVIFRIDNGPMLNARYNTRMEKFLLFEEKKSTLNIIQEVPRGPLCYHSVSLQPEVIHLGSKLSVHPKYSIKKSTPKLFSIPGKIYLGSKLTLHPWSYRQP